MASIVVNGDTSGSITLSAPAVAGSSVLTLPAVTDTVAGIAATQTLTHKSIVATQLTGTIAAARLPAGSVLQVVAATFSTSTSTTSTSFVATGLTASITPTSATSKIFIATDGAADTNGNGEQVTFTIFRNSTNIAPAGVSGMTNIFATSSRVIGSVSMVFLDSPSTTSATTYAAYIRTSSGTSVSFPQQSGTASIILMEIAA